jgi:two-component sensor histidine kinase
MTTPAEVVRQHTDLDGEDLTHLQGLMAWWGMLADLSFADLLLLAPAREGGFVILGQMRPSTAQTVHLEDLVGQVVEERGMPLVARAWRLQEMVEGERELSRGERVRSECIPVRREGRMLAVLDRQSPVSVRRRPGELERTYVSLFGRFARMVMEGTFPFPYGEDVPEGEESPRVGDGVIVLDEGARLVYASPNAVNAFHRMGVTSNLAGLRLAELGVDDSAVPLSFQTGRPVTEEIERRPDVVVMLRCIPLLAGGRMDGALVLLRDMTDLRRRDRLLLSKDASIKEIHHRVKNNLQTISSLLRLQARRLASEEGRDALREAERRIQSMAAVHEILSRDTRDQVPFDQIVPLLVRMAEDAVVASRPVRVEVSGHAGELVAEVATPLAVVLTELLQNAAQHAFAELPEQPQAGGEEPGLVQLDLTRAQGRLTVRVQDNGQGLPEGFCLGHPASLGLSIVQHLVADQLGGSITLSSRAGTLAEVSVPVPDGAG